MEDGFHNLFAVQRGPQKLFLVAPGFSVSQTSKLLQKEMLCKVVRLLWQVHVGFTLVMNRSGVYLHVAQDHSFQTHRSPVVLSAPEVSECVPTNPNELH